jgi:predicted site-specific integrase-resolvase
MMELFAVKNSQPIEVMKQVLENKNDILEDFIAIITSFCARLYGKRKNIKRTRKLIEDLKDA